MKLDRWIRKLMPEEGRFAELLAQGTKNLVSAARLFAELAEGEDLELRRLKIIELRAAEHEGDRITRRIFETLNATFITPFDREDIRSLATDLDDILDYLEGVGQHVELFELEESPAGFQRFAGILVELATEVDRVTSLLWDMRNRPEIRRSLVRISDLENNADQVYHAVIAELFKSDGLDPVEILKWKEVYQGLEEACDECKDYSHVVGNILAKQG